MMILPNWMLLLLILLLAASPIVALVLSHLQQSKLMRIFSEKQGIPINILEGKPEEKHTVSAKPERQRISIPIPGARPNLNPPAYAKKATEMKQ